MQINSLKGTNMEVTEAIRDYVFSKLEMIEKLVVNYEPVAELSVEVGKTTLHHNKGPFFRCEMNLKLPGVMLRAEQEAGDLYAAIDGVKDQLREQIKRHKEKKMDKQRVPRPGK